MSIHQLLLFFLTTFAALLILGHRVQGMILIKRFINTVEPVLKDRPTGHKNMISQDRWSLVTGSVTLKCGTFCQEYVVLQDRWSLMAVVSQDRLHCN